MTIEVINFTGAEVANRSFNFVRPCRSVSAELGRSWGTTIRA